MTENLINVLKGAVTEKALEAISGHIGADASNTKSGVNAIIPSLLAGILGKSGSATTAPSWWTTVADMFLNDNTDGLNHGMLSNPDFLTKGKALVSNLFGNNTDTVVNAVAQSSGLAKEKSSGLLAAVAPMLIGVITKWMKAKGLGFGDMIKGLFEHKSSIMSALPSGLSSSMLGFADKVKMPEVEAPKGGSNWLYWLLGALALLLLLWFMFGKGCKQKTQTVVNDSTVVKIDSLANKTVDAIKGKLNDAGEWVYDLGQNVKRKLADGLEIEVGENSVENKLVNFIEDKNKPVDKTTWFTMDRLYFETGKNTLTAASAEQLKNIAAIMKAYKDVHLKIGGYTDNTGSAEGNMKLSAERANTAMNELVKLGVEKARLEAEGYGSQFPVASNDTPEGRAQNRRIDVRVTAK